MHHGSGVGGHLVGLVGGVGVDHHDLVEQRGALHQRLADPADHVAHRRGLDPDPATGRGVPHGVVEQVADHPGQVRHRRRDLRGRFMELTLEHHTSGIGDHAAGGDGVRDEVPETDPFEVEREGAGLDPAELEQIVDQMGQAFVIDNRAGGNGVIGADLVAKAPVLPMFYLAITIHQENYLSPIQNTQTL